MLSKKSFVTICLSKLLSCADDFCKDFGPSPSGTIGSPEYVRVFILVALARAIGLI